ncbi:hypothetical protein FJZ19_05380 [Candidatus Pacearchaeota archaeon]|nr:hypothetical protein [Candidatus Pacearchaeota archaeon]
MRKIKKGEGTHYGIIFALILGLIVIVISIYFLFYEYFSEEEISKEACRQSVILRASLPQKGLISTKDLMPLRCKTEVININYKDVKKAQKAFDNALLDCWWLVGNGDFKIFPGELKEYKTNCIICSRIHINSNVRDYYTTNKIDLRAAVLTKFKNGKNYWQYLGEINPNANPWKLVRGGGDKFSVIYSNEAIFWSTLFEVLFSSPVFPVVADYFNYGNEAGASSKGTGVVLPYYFKPEDGDMFIAVSSPASSSPKSSPALFFFQAQQMNSAMKDLSGANAILLPDTPLCGTIESVPA